MNEQFYFNTKSSFENLVTKILHLRYRIENAKILTGNHTCTLRMMFCTLCARTAYPAQTLECTAVVSTFPRDFSLHLLIQREV